MPEQTKKSKRGGPRPGSGRPKGVKNKTTIMKEELHKEVLTRAVENADTPLEVMLGIMRDPDTEPSMRFEAAKAAAPYVHPRLSQVDSTVTHKNAADEFDESELLAIARTGSPRAAGPANGKSEPDQVH
jgi:hypothetical protein